MDAAELSEFPFPSPALSPGERENSPLAGTPEASRSVPARDESLPLPRERVGGEGKRPSFHREAAKTLQSVQRPERVNRRRAQADFIQIAVANQFAQCGHDIGFAALHEQPLRLHAPKQIVAPQGRDQFFRGGLVEPCRRDRLGVL